MDIMIGTSSAQWMSTIVVTEPHLQSDQTQTGIQGAPDEQSSSTSATSIQDEVNGGSSNLTNWESPGMKQGVSCEKKSIERESEEEMEEAAGEEVSERKEDEAVVDGDDREPDELVAGRSRAEAE
ncbi:unnamed protein product [Clavelina lepadiformis]|uniref:Uncharacterized protein n=1 Tax=Clavelina lepadiformis TaxID=159417 RepID=A0ABP0FUP9_CLALP